MDQIVQKNFEHPGILAEQKQEMKRIFEAIHTLPDHHKTVLILSKIMRHSQVEVAEIMKTTPKAVESMLQRAKSALHKKLKIKEGN
jgi:RNA polymerase sigma-70 factor (ECF subfamily)